ncbi:MAG: Ig-like domain-containing protein, partial [Tenericutes bacterium]|nr:Ig-like domain-containing protein [Mycoplasmatota bacterium]
MKKITITLTSFLFLFIIFGILNINALDRKPSDFDNITYIIGTHEFTIDMPMTTERIMLAAKTIEGDSEKDMIILYKNVEGEWINTITKKILSPSELPTTFNIQYTNTVSLNKAQDAPIEALVGVAPTSTANNDGKITGTTVQMEYKLKTSTEWKKILGSEITGLSTGTYQVRYAAKTGFNAGTSKEVTISPYVKSSDSTLNKIKINGIELLGFSMSTLTYDVELEAGTIVVPTIEVELTDIKATTLVTNATTLPGTTKIVVTAENRTKTTYTIKFTVKVIIVSAITVTGDGSATTIETNAGTLQMSALVGPSNASNKAVTWSVTNNTIATISTTGLLTAVTNGTVTV